MLVVSRRKGQKILIGDDVEIVVSQISGSHVRLAIRAPKEVTVLRGEVLEGAAEATEAAQPAVAVAIPEASTAEGAVAAEAAAAGAAEANADAAVQEAAPAVEAGSSRQK